MNKLELLEKYLAEELSPQEQSAFDSLMREDAEFKEEVQLAVVLNANHRVQQKLHFKKLLQEQTTPEIKETPVRRLPLRRLRSIAAVLLLGLSLAMGWLMFGSQNANNMVAEGLSQKYPSPTITMNEVVDPNWKDAIKAYKTGNFPTAIAALERSIGKEEGNTAEKHFYLGLCYLYQKVADHEKGIQHLKKSKELNPSIYKQQANWFISLASLNIGDKEEARTLLKDMVDANGWKSTEAAELLKEL